MHILLMSLVPLIEGFLNTYHPKLLNQSNVFGFSSFPLLRIQSPGVNSYWKIRHYTHFLIFLFHCGLQ